MNWLDSGLFLRLTYFRTMHSLVRADWYVKADDDIFFRVDRLLDELRRIMATWEPRGGIAMYIGCMKKGRGRLRVLFECVFRLLARFD